MKWLILEFGLISSIIITLYPYDRSVANVVSEWREGGKGDDWSEGETTESTKVVWFLVYLVNDSLVCVSLIPSTSLGSLRSRLRIIIFVPGKRLSLPTVVFHRFF